MRKTLSFIIAFSILFSCSPVLGEENKKLEFKIEDAVRSGLDNSILLLQVKNQIDISAVASDRANYFGNQLKSGKSRLNSSASKISAAQKQIDESQVRLNQAKSAINSGVAPSDIALTDPSTGQAVKDSGGNIIVIPKGSSVSSYLDSLGLGSYSSTVIGSVKSGLDTQQTTLDSSKTLLDQSKASLASGQSKLESSLESASTALAENLNINDLSIFSPSDLNDIMTISSDISYEVTRSSYDIYKNQLAVLIQKCYYDVLKAQKMLEVKKAAVERAERQYSFSKDGFEAGMKAKDDMLLANTYFLGTQIELVKAESDLKNAVIELKRNMNIPAETEIVLKDVFAEMIEVMDMKEGLENGLKNRLEIRKASAEVIIYDSNLEIVRKRYPSNTFQFKESKLMKEKARLNYDKTRVDVDASIRQSFETMKSAGQMLATSKEMVAQAKQSVEIAEFKYKEGFAAESSLLKKLDIEASAGTVVEVLAAQENLSQVEQKVVEITYGYNLAKMKYLNDIGKQIYEDTKPKDE